MTKKMMVKEMTRKLGYYFMKDVKNRNLEEVRDVYVSFKKIYG